MKKIICLLLIAMMLFPSALAEGKNTKKSDTGSNNPLFQVKDLSEKELYSLYSQTQSQIRLLNFNTKDLYNTTVNYDELERNPSYYKLNRYCFTGEIIQVIEGSSSVSYRIAKDKDQNQVFLVTYERPENAERFLNGDIVTAYVKFLGLETYKSKVTKDNYEEYARNPDKYEGNDITLKAKVLQVVERSYGPNIYRVSVDSDSSSVFYVEFTPAKGASRILEKDIVTIKGEFYGIYTYTTTLGSSVSIPAILATEMKKK